MRVPLVAACLLAAGCIGLPPPTGEDDAPRVARPFDGCARLLVAPEREAFSAYQPLSVALAFHNCGTEAVNVTGDDLCAFTTLNVTLHRGDARYVLRGESAALGGSAKHVCGDVTRDPVPVLPGAWLNETARWNGTVIDRIEPCAMPCGLRMGARPAEAGAWRIVATAFTHRGSVSGEANVTLSPPRVPPLPPPGDLRFVMNASYRVGEEVDVVLENVGERPYRYLTLYAACGLQYHADDGRPFAVPEGTHCDIPNTDTLEPGERVVLFRWSLDECTVDNWGCTESAPLPPGTYHVQGAFYPAVDDWWRNAEDKAEAGFTFRIVT